MSFLNIMKCFFTIVFILLSSLMIFAQKQAEVIVTSTYLRKSPDYSAEKIQTLQKGDKVTLEKSREASGWYYVSISNGTVKGWILVSTVRPLKNEDKVDQTPKPTLTPVISSPKPTSPVTTPTPTVNPSPTADIVEEDNETVKIDTEEVSLNVRVVDGNNRPVSKLNESDFKVYEDGVLQPITSLTTAEVPIINALVIDNSRSLRTQLKKVIEASKIIIGTNRPNDETSVVRFISSNKIEVVQDFTPDKTLLNDALDNLFVDGGQTAIIDAVYRAAKMVGEYQNSGKKEDVKLRTLILVSDGDDRVSTYQEQQLFELLRNSYVQIYAIGFINNLSDISDAETGISRREKARSFLTRLAQETGGKVYFPDSIDELAKIATDISGELRTQYVISYSPTNDIHDGGFRKIKVEIANGANNEKRTANTRSGRNAPINR